MLGMNLNLISIAYCYPCVSLGMGLPSYNNYVGLCVFLFVKTRKDYNLVSYYFVIHITAKALIVMNELKVKLYGFIVCGFKLNA